MAKYKLETLVKDATLRRSLSKALAGDGHLSYKEVRSLLVSALDGKGVRRQEYDDLQAILQKAKTLDARSKALIQGFLKAHYRPRAKANGSGDKLTANFSLKEFDCNDGTPVPKELTANVTDLAKNLQVLRDTVKVSIKINSGYRTPAHNKKVGGKSQSLHLSAKAADIVVRGMTPTKVKTQIEALIKSGKMDQGGIGLYNTFVHYDVRGSKARW